MKNRLNNNFRDLIRKSGYKATDTRLAVLTVLQKSAKPISPQTIIEKIDTKADQATIYRILKIYKNIGLIRQIDFHHNHPHYELADTNDHHHLICASCGLSEEITGCEVNEMKKSVLRQAKQFGEIKEHSLEFYGTCNKCVKVQKLN
jgi:Fe2+ or Zn2+ uptake regulation protein